MRPENRLESNFRYLGVKKHMIEFCDLIFRYIYLYIYICLTEYSVQNEVHIPYNTDRWVSWYQVPGIKNVINIENRIFLVLSQPKKGFWCDKEKN
jgi:hypothetical protein